MPPGHADGGAPSAARRRSASHVVMGPDWGDMFANVGRNLEESGIALYQSVARKP